MDADSSGSYAENGFTDLVGIGDNPGGGYFYHRQSFVEWGHGIPELWFGTTDTTMADTDRPDTDVIKTNGRAVGEGLRTFAADFIEAVAELVELDRRIARQNDLHRNGLDVHNGRESGGHRQRVGGSGCQEQAVS